MYNSSYMPPLSVNMGRIDLALSIRLAHLSDYCGVPSAKRMDTILVLYLILKLNYSFYNDHDTDNVEITF